MSFRFVAFRHVFVGLEGDGMVVEKKVEVVGRALCGALLVDARLVIKLVC